MRSDGPRLKRLKDLVEQLERLPASPDRDRVLSDVRARAVDVDTGEATTPMRLVDDVLAGVPIPVAPAPARPVAPPRVEPAPALERAPAPADDEPRPATAERDDLDDAADLLELEGAGEWLSLEDPGLPEDPAPRHARPWTLGLRG